MQTHLVKVKFFNTHTSNRVYDLKNSRDMWLIEHYKDTFGTENISLLTVKEEKNDG